MISSTLDTLLPMGAAMGKEVPACTDLTVRWTIGPVAPPQMRGRSSPIMSETIPTIKTVTAAEGPRNGTNFRSSGITAVCARTSAVSFGRRRRRAVRWSITAAATILESIMSAPGDRGAGVTLWRVVAFAQAAEGRRIEERDTFRDEYSSCRVARGSAIAALFVAVVRRTKTRVTRCAAVFGRVLPAADVFPRSRGSEI